MSTAFSLSVCIFCGSRTGRRPEYVEAARQTGRILAENGWRLVYGAGDIGIMGEVARAAQAQGGATFGVIPQHLVDLEVGKTDLNAYVVTETMHERKKVMFMNAHAVVLLPGGAGSLDEIFEVLTWRQIGLHEKPIIVVNVAGYWNPFLALVDHVIAEGFADASLREMLTVIDGPGELPAALADLCAAPPGRIMRGA